MFGAIIGDIIGSVYERNNIKTKEFELFSPECRFTDDTVMSLAVASACFAWWKTEDVEKFKEALVNEMQRLGREYPDRGYGGMFRKWIFSDNPKPYNSFGNGSAMRVSPVAYAATTLEEAELLAKTSAEVTHNHPEGIKGAQAVAAAIFLSRLGMSKGEIKSYVEKHYYELNFTLDEIREDYSFDATCQGSVPQAIVAFLESADYEDAVRNAISIGGDSDTIACITGSIAGAFYEKQNRPNGGIPYAIYKKAFEYISSDPLFNIYVKFSGKLNSIPPFMKPYVPELDKYRNVFIESRDFEGYEQGGMKIFHCCDPGSSRFGVYFYDLYKNDERHEEFLKITEETFDFLYVFFSEVIHGFYAYDSANPLKDSGMAEIYKKAQSVKADLIAEQVTENLKHYLHHVKLETLNEHESPYILAEDGRYRKNEDKFWELIFKNKQQIIDLYDAFFWFVFEHMSCGDPRGDCDNAGYIINIEGF